MKVHELQKLLKKLPKNAEIQIGMHDDQHGHCLSRDILPFPCVAKSVVSNSEDSEFVTVENFFFGDIECQVFDIPESAWEENQNDFSDTSVLIF
jgi:hypothetical protein